MGVSTLLWYGKWIERFIWLIQLHMLFTFYTPLPRAVKFFARRCEQFRRNWHVAFAFHGQQLAFRHYCFCYNRLLVLGTGANLRLVQASKVQRHDGNASLRVLAWFPFASSRSKTLFWWRNGSRVKRRRLLVSLCDALVFAAIWTFRASMSHSCYYPESKTPKLSMGHTS